MAKQLNVNLAFTADTKKVKTELDSLQKQLTNLINNANKNNGMLTLTKDIQNASVAAATLKTQLTEATNADTGKLDLGKFNESLKKSGMTIESYKNALVSLGPQGAKAFSTLAQSITMAELPLKRSNLLLEKFGTTLKNTARWQISSSILHGFMGSIQSAFHYAQDLNESLNNIRIVTGYNTDQMARFASEANKAAQALSTTTTEYTNASLIYYQQGLSDDEVKKRTDVTVKMANVTRESAEEISQQLTAVWNNFDNGTKSLEYYADAMTALGAKTASSSAEIAQGLEKFAAVAETVGLSYEYATAALATVTATTRQSADVVGNAFKTLFARLQNLKLDETLEDGTDLTKYSKALADVGINIKNTDGELKQMDQILDELGAKWDTLGKNQQVALANTVAGVRQYTQLIALMDNWDFFKENVEVAKDSEGTLGKQADIYAESWEAAQKRVKAAAEDVYNSLINDDFFISLNNSLAGALKVVKGFISSLGGVKGLLISIGALLTTIYKTQITEGLQNFIYSIQMMTEKGRASVNALREETNKQLTSMFSGEGFVGEKMGQAYASQAKVQQTLVDNAKNMTTEQQKVAQLLVDQHNTLVQEAIESGKLANNAEEAAKSLGRMQVLQAKEKAAAYGSEPLKTSKGFQASTTKNVVDQIKLYQQLTKQVTTFKTVMERTFNFDETLETYKSQIDAIASSFENDAQMVELFGAKGATAFQQFAQEIRNAQTTEEAHNAIEKFFAETMQTVEQELITSRNVMESLEIETKETDTAFGQLGERLAEVILALAKCSSSAQQTGDNLNKIPAAITSGTQLFTSFGQTVMTTSMAISSLIGLIDTWNNEDLSAGQKLLSTMMTLGMVIPMVTSMLQLYGTTQLTVNANSLAATILNSGLFASWITVATGEEAAAAGAVTFEAAISPLLFLLAPIIAAVAALVAIIYGLKVAFDAIHAASPEGQLEAAQEQSKELANALEQAKKEAEELASAFDNYNNAVATLEDCTAGTEEWREALEKVNEEVINILDNYPDLAKINGIVTRNEKTGQLELDKNLMQQQIDSMNQGVKAAQIANLIGQRNVKEKQLNVDKANFGAQIYHYANENGEQLNEQIFSELAKHSTDFINLYDDEFKTAVEEVAKNLGIASDDIGEYFLSYKDDLDKLGVSTREVETSMKNLSLVAANEALSEKGYSDTVIKMAANSFEELIKQEEQKLEDKEWGQEGISKIDQVNDEARKIFDEYAHAIGLQGATLIDTEGDDDPQDRKFIYKNAAGEEQDPVSLETMRTAVATARALEGLGDSANKAQELLANITKNTDSSMTANALGKWVASGDLSQLTQEENNALHKNEVWYGQEDFLKRAFGVDNLDEVANLLGKESGKEVLEGYQDAQQAYSDEFVKIKQHMSKSVEAVFDELDDRGSGVFNKLTLEGQKNIANILTRVFDGGGKEGLSSVSNIISQLKTDEVKVFSDTLNGIDWDDTSVNDLSVALEEAGISTDHFRDDLVTLVDSINSNSGALSFSQLAENYKEVSDIINGIQTGDIIEEEDYIKLGNAADGYFTRMMDGTYKLTGDAEEFYKTVQNRQIDKYKENISKIKDKQNFLTEMKGYDFEGLMSPSMSAYHTQDASGKETLNNITYDKVSVQQQIDIIRELGDQSEDTKNKIAEWQTLLTEDGNIGVDSLKEIADTVAQCGEEWENLDSKIQNLQGEMLQMDIAIASSYNSFEDLRDALEHDVISLEAFNTAAVNLDKIKDIENLDPEELENFADYLKDIADSSSDLANGMSDAASEIVAKGIMKMNDGIDQLASNWEDWSSILTDSTSSAEEYSEAMGGMKEAMADLLDISKDFIDSKFIKENMEDIKLAAEGDADAIDRLKANLVDPIVAKIAVDNKINEADLMNDVNDLQSKLDALGPISIGSEIDDTGFIDACNEMIAASHMTTEQVNALFDAMGFEANFAEEGQSIESKVPEYTTHHEIKNRTSNKMGENGPEIETFDEVTWTEQTGEHIAEGEFPAFAFSTNGEVPKINSITKKASGSSNNYSSKNKGGTNSPGGKKSGGGGGGGGKGKEPDHKDPVKDEVDRYAEIKNAIAKVNHELEKNEQLQKQLNSYEQHYAGKTLIKALEKENELLKDKRDILDKQYENYERLYEIQSQELAELKGTIGGTWDGDALQNYAELYQANIDRYNAAIEAYNAMTQELQETIGKQMIADAQQAYETYKQALERYQQLYYSEMYDTENKLAEIQQQQIDNQMKIIENNLKKWEIDVELKLDTTRLKREWDEFIHDVEKDFRKVFEDVSLDDALDMEKFKTYEDDAETKMQQIADVEEEIKRMEEAKDENGVVQLDDDMMFGSISEAQEYLKKLQSELVEVGNNLNELYKNVWDNYIKGLEQASKRFEMINKKAEHLTHELEFEKELIELVYGDKAYDLMNKYYKVQQKNIENQAAATKKQADFWEKQFNKAYELNKDKHKVDLDDMSTWTEDMKKAYDEMIDSQEKLNDLVLEGIRNAKEEYLNNVAKSFDKMDKNLWGMSFEDVQSNWDFMQRKADEYLDDVEKIYKIQTLSNKINQDIENSPNIKAQEKLAKFRESELEALREKERLTQDDIALAEARYQIVLKEIALEDAQNNKTSMKLARDTSGNWTYQYVADENDIMSKQQELLDAYNNLYETADNAYQHAMELAMEIYEEYQEKLRTVAEDTTLSDEEKYIKMKELGDQYLPELEAAVASSEEYKGQLILATAGVFERACAQDKKNYETLTTDEKALVDGLKQHNITEFSALETAIKENFGNIGTKAQEVFKDTNTNSQTAAAGVIDYWSENPDSVDKVMNTTFKSIVKYTKNFEKELEKLEKVSGKNITDKGGVVDDLKKVEKQVDDVKEETEEAVDDMDESLDDLRKNIEEVEEAWNGVIDKIKEAISTIEEFLRIQEEAMSPTGPAVGPVGPGGPGTPGGPSTPGDPNSPGGPGGPGNGDVVVTGARVVAATADEHWIVRLIYSDGSSETGRTQKASSSFIGKKKGSVEFKTGGYTGDWGDQTGRLAVLHSKELVLNQKDTKNMLDTVNSVRDIAALNNSISDTIANSIGQLIMKTIDAGMGTSINTSTAGNNENNVFNITAEFPNANDVQTIKDAILSLPNLASQYIHQY